MTEEIVTLPWRLADLPDPAPDAPRVVSTFCGAGGSSMGYMLAGYRLAGAVDVDPVQLGAYEANLPCPLPWLGPVGEVKDRPELVEAWYGVDVLDGSPPCTPFSVGGAREKSWGVSRRWREGDVVQVLDRLFFDYLDLVDVLRPKTFVAENVAGLVQGKAVGYAKAVVAGGRALGYDVQVFRLAAAQYGAPQIRQRVFFVGRRHDLGLSEVQVPSPLPVVTPGEAMAGAEDHPARWLRPGTTHRDIWDSIAPGRGGEDFYIGQGKKGSGFSYLKVHPDRPTSALAASSYFLHWDEPRLLSNPELLRMGTFPDDYQVPDGKDRARYLVGMSVPPFLARAVAGAVKDVLRG